MSDPISDRALLLIELAGIRELDRISDLGYNRWSTVKHGRGKVRAEELNVLQSFFPNYRLWLISGEIAPEIGQTSPDYDEANNNLKERGQA